jgi:hypothetical protein
LIIVTYLNSGKGDSNGPHLKKIKLVVADLHNTSETLPCGKITTFR